MDGILVVDKPVGPTSHDVVALVRRLAATKRVGHGGTLDPFASGVLPLFLGRATRMLEYHLGDRKAYRATVCIGAGSTTDDLEGELTPAAAVPDRAAIEAALPSFVGEIEQVPPAYSAIKVAGRRAYAMARAGESPELKARTVTISGLDLIEWDGSEPDRPVAILDVRCSAGTYVRAIARDLGRAVGSEAYLGALTRTATGPFAIAGARTLDDLRAAAADGRLDDLLLPPDSGLDEMPPVDLSEAEVAEIARGRAVRPSRWSPDADSEPDESVDGALGGLATAVAERRYRLVDPVGRLVAVARVAGGRLAPDKVFVDPPPSERPDAVALSERDPDASDDADPASPDDP